MAEQSLTVTFVTESELDDQNAVVDVRLDSTRNNNETQFLYGQKGYYQILTYPTTATISQQSSDGIVTEEGSGYETFTEQISFANSNSSTVSYPVASITSSEWLGNNLGSISFLGKTISSSQSGVGILSITYTSFYRRYAISVPTRSSSTYSVLIYISIS